MRLIYTSKGMSEKFGVARYTLGARYLSKNTVFYNSFTDLGEQIIVEKLTQNSQIPQLAQFPSPRTHSLLFYS